MTNLSHGIKAEDNAELYLIKHGYEIIERNWKTKWCEIDIVAKLNATIFFVEVKYRLNDTFGTGLDYITPKKLKQMTRAAEGWVQATNWLGDYQLAVIEVGGETYKVSQFLTEI